MRPATTYSPNAELGVSTIGPDRLNGRVRNGNGCIPVGNITGLIEPLEPDQAHAGQEGVWMTAAYARSSPRSHSERTPYDDSSKNDETANVFTRSPTGGSIEEYGQASRTISTASLKRLTALTLAAYQTGSLPVSFRGLAARETLS